MKRTSIRKAAGIALGVTAMTVFSTQASAFTPFNIGTFDGTTTVSLTENAFYDGWSGSSLSNFGSENRAQWFKIQIGTAADITSGATHNVNFEISQTAFASPMITQGLSMWTSGTTPYVPSGFLDKFNQVMGKNDTTSIAAPSTTNNGGILGNGIGNVIDEHDGWVAYIQNGTTFTNGDGDIVANGGSANMGSGVVSGYSADVSGTDSSLSLYNLVSGYYVFAIGGVCPDGLTTCDPGSPDGPGGVDIRNFHLAISTASPVPLPAAVWFFSSAIAGLGFSARRTKVEA